MLAANSTPNPMLISRARGECGTSGGDARSHTQNTPAARMPRNVISDSTSMPEANTTLLSTSAALNDNAAPMPGP